MDKGILVTILLCDPETVVQFVKFGYLDYLKSSIRESCLGDSIKSQMKAALSNDINYDWLT